MYPAEFGCFKLPFFVMRGLGPSLVPRPVPLRFHLAPPIAVPRVADPSPRAIAELHREATERMRALIDEAMIADGIEGRAT